MRRNGISLHENPKWTVVAALAYAALSFLLLVLTVILSNVHLGRLITLNQSSYQYSVLMTESVGQDDYLRFEASIGFTTTPDSDKGVNADIVMQTEESDYTDSVAWNANKLSPFEIAISEDIAHAYCLGMGDILYSKHIVDGNQYAYTITQVLPYVASVRSDTGSYTDGVVIMGYDEQYVLNISHSMVIFTGEPIEELAQKYSQVPVGIEYRSDSVEALKRRVTLYLLLLAAIAVTLTLIFVFSLTQLIMSDYKRLITFGFKKHQLSMTYNVYIAVPFVLSLLCVSCGFLAFLRITGFPGTDVWFLLILIMVEVVALVFAVSFAKWKAWRS